MNRRGFIQTSLVSALAPAVSHGSAPSGAFSFVLLGDLHFDRPEHHDFAWLKENKAGDLSQIENYCCLTKEVMPQVFDAVRRKLALLRQTDAPPAFVLQVGDLVEGLCGSEELAARQNREALDYVAQADFGMPFLFTKGNHDVTGDGALDAFNKVLQPFMAEQAAKVDAQHQDTKTANYSVKFGDAEFCFFDAYDKSSLEWLEAAAAKRTGDHWFVTVHPPVVPYGARATWYLYAGEKSKASREKLLQILGSQEALVLGGHLHKFSSLTRLSGGRQFRQLAVSSVVSAPDQNIKNRCEGLDSYTGDQVQLEPKHSPETESLRREIYQMERPNVTQFEYAETAGYAVVTVSGASVKAQIYSGASAEPWHELTLA